MENARATGPDRASGRASIFLLTLGVLLLEIACTRIFSFSLWYHFTYVAISVALLGYGSSGAFLAASGRLARRDPATLMSDSMFLASVGVLVTLLTILFIPLEPFAIATDPKQLVLMVLLFVLCSTPFFAAGMAMAAAFRVTSSPHGVYFADLIGAGAGCALALGSIWVLGSPGTAVASAAIFVLASLMSAAPERRRIYAGVGGAVVLACALLVGIVPFRPSAEKLLAKMMAKGFVPPYSRWSPIFRVDIYPEPVTNVSGKRGLSPHFTGTTPLVRFISHDGTAEAPIYEFKGDPKELDFLRHNVSAVPYLVAHQPSVLVIGLGGGFDLLNGIANGASHITGVELDPVTVEVGKGREAEFNGHIFSRPDVDVVVAEGRSFLRHSDRRYDIIQLTGVDTLSALSTGAYMLAESYLHTVEAMQEKLGHLTPDGTLSLMLYDLPWQTNEARFTVRHISNFIGAAERVGIERPADHVAIIATPGKVAAVEMLFKPRPFTAAEVRTLREFARTEGFEVWHLPGDPPATLHTQLLTADPASRERILAAYPLNVAATPDDRPFYYRFYRWRDLMNPHRWEVDYGLTLATGQLVLGAILLVSIVTSLALVLGPLLARPALRRPGSGRFALYFAAIGLGFMFIEISLIQHFILFLGHPTYSVAIILLALLIWTGIGSYVSGRASMSERAIVRAGFMALVVLIPLYAWLLPSLFNRWLGTPANFRYAVTVLSLMPLGLTLGVFFPAGLREVRRHDELLVPWAWGANGAASVVGSILSIVLAISFGFQAVLLMAVGVYLAGVAALLSVPPATEDRAKLAA
jgi:hypothetical protein